MGLLVLYPQLNKIFRADSNITAIYSMTTDTDGPPQTHTREHLIVTLLAQLQHSYPHSDSKGHNGLVVTVRATPDFCLSRGEAVSDSYGGFALTTMLSMLH